MEDIVVNMPEELMVCSILVKRLYEKIMDPILSSNELPRIEIEILLFLANHPEYNTATSIVSHKGYTKSHVSTALKHLELTGYISKKHPANNKKTYCLHIEDKAMTLIQEAQQYKKKFSEVLCKDLSDESLRNLWDCLTRIAENAGIKTEA